MATEILQLGSAGRPVTGVMQLAQLESQARPAVLFCRPIGQEGIRTNTMYRVMAERLAREHCCALRFDYYGTGDAVGDEIQQTISQCAHDVVSAHQALAERGHSSITWFAMRLGANIALQAIALCNHPPQQLVLWEPVLNGPAYLDSLQAAHRAELCREYGHPWPRLLALKKVVEPVLPGHLLGFEYGSTMTEEIRGIDTLNVRAALRRHVRIVCALRQEDHHAAQVLPHSESLHVCTVGTVTDWFSSQAMGSAVAPADAIQTLLDTVSS
jgi:uncharacterized protein